MFTAFPITSKDADGQAKGEKRAHHTGNGFDITWFMRYLGIKRGPGNKFKSGSEKSKELTGPIKSISEMTDNETKGDKTEKPKQEEWGDAEMRKGANTIIQWKYYDPTHPTEKNGGATSPSFFKFKQSVNDHPNAKFTILSVIPENPNEDSYSKNEILEYLAK